MIRTVLLSLALALGPLIASAADYTGTVEGRVADAVTGRPISGATAVLVRDQSSDRARAQTDAQGRYVFSQIPEGLYSLEVEADVHLRASEPQVRVARNKAATVNFSLARALTSSMEEVVVSARAPRMDAFATPATVELNREDIRRAPGSFGDVFRAMDTLPGVVATGEFSSFTVRGNRPRDNLILIDGIPFDKVTHFDQELGEESDIAGGGRYSIFAPNLVGGARFSPGGWRASEGGKFGSLLELEVARGNLSSSTAAAQLDFGGMEFSYEGPSYIEDNTSLLFSARTFDFSQVLDLVGEDNDIGTPKLTDIIFKSVSELNDAHSLELLAIHATEDYERTIDNVLLSPDFEDVGLQTAEQDSNLLGVTWRWNLGAAARLRTALYYSDSSKLSSQGEAYPDLAGENPTAENTPIRPDILRYTEDQTEVGVRTDFTTEFSSGATLSAGARVAQVDLDFSQTLADDWVRYVYDSSDTRPPGQEFIVLTPENINSGLTAKATQVAAYADYSHPFGNFTITPGVRFENDEFSGESMLSPRLAATWQPNARTRAWVGAGTYYQAPRYIELSLDPENADLEHERSDQLAIGVSHDFTGDLRFVAEGYYQRLRDLIVFDDRTTGVARNIGEGEALGVDLMLTKRLSNRWSATATYSWADSRRDDNLGEGEYPSDWDRRHGFGLVGTWDITDHWSVSGKWRFASGRPTDSYVVHEDVLAGSGLPYAYRYSKELLANNVDRVPDFHTLTLRVDYHRRLGPVNMIAFMDISNVYGRKNVNSYEWDERRGLNIADGMDETLPFFAVKFEYSWTP